MIGSTVSHYKILEKLGAGGMSVVYKAQDLHLDRYVALKFLPPAVAEDELTRNRFIREAKAASALDHSNICTIHEIGETADGQLFIVMAHYEGETLKQRRERGPLPYDEVIRVVRQVGLGLRRAHSAGIVHRDIKPANIMITVEGDVKILDFGLAKMTDQTQLTETGSKLGTIAYMSPEQVQGVDVDHRTDLWSLGIILYEMLTGELPFRSDSPGAVLHAILNQDVPRPSSLNKTIPPFLDRIVARAVQRDCADRYQSAEEMTHDLTDLLDDSTSPGLNDFTVTERFPKPSGPSRGSPRRAIRWAFPAAVVVAVSVISVTQLSRENSWLRSRALGLTGSFDRYRSAQKPVTGRIHEIPGLPHGIIKPSFAPSGDLLAVIAPDGATGRHLLHLTKLGTGELLPLVPQMDVRGPTPEFTSDGNHILFTSYRGDSARITPDVWQVSVLGGRLQRIVEAASAADFSSDGSRLVYASVTEGGTEILVRHPDGSVSNIAEVGYWPRWSPDDKWIAYTTSNPEGGDGHLFIVRPNASDRRQLTQEISQLYGLCWTPDSEWIVYASDAFGLFGLWATSIRGKTVQMTSGPGTCTAPTVSPDGSRVAFVYYIDATTVYVASAPEEPPAALITRDMILSASLSPHGDRLALVIGSRTRDPAISVIDLDTGTESVVSSIPAWRVRWSHDERFLLAAGRSTTTDDTGIWKLPIDGGLSVLITSVSTDRWDWPDLSPDGSLLCAVRSDEMHSELVVRDMDSGIESIVATASRIIGPRWSPDGLRIAWSGDVRPADTASSGIWVISSDGTGRRRLTQDGAFPIWDRRSNSLLFTRYQEFAGLWRIGLEGGETEQLRGPIESARSFIIDAFDKSAENSTVLMLVNKSRDLLYMIEDLNL